MCSGLGCMKLTPPCVHDFRWICTFSIGVATNSFTEATTFSRSILWLNSSHLFYFKMSKAMKSITLNHCGHGNLSTEMTDNNTLHSRSDAK